MAADTDLLIRPLGTEARAVEERPGMALIAGGTFTMGSNNHYPEEAPEHDVRVNGFWIDRHAVTNRAFAQFVKATGYVTFAEQPANAEDYPGARPEMLAPSSVVFKKTRRGVDLRNPYEWWTYVAGADWRHPQGPDSSIKGLEDHPVVHVTCDDALAYAQWADKRLPTEAEWEFAARGGLEGADFVWGDVFTPNGKHLANTWQGEFPWQNLAFDGFAGTSPVGSFPPNGYGLYDMAGNVWELTSDFYQEHSRIRNACCTIDNPRGPLAEDSCDPRNGASRIPRRVMKGGSYLCAPNYCQRYRPAARMAQPVDTSTCHVGFRCASD